MERLHHGCGTGRLVWQGTEWVQLAVGQNQYHFGVGEFTTHFRTCFSGDWDVRWGYGVLTHGQLGMLRAFNIIQPVPKAVGGMSQTYKNCSWALCFYLPLFLLHFLFLSLSLSLPISFSSSSSSSFSFCLSYLSLSSYLSFPFLLLLLFRFLFCFLFSCALPLSIFLFSSNTSS